MSDTPPQFPTPGGNPPWQPQGPGPNPGPAGAWGTAPPGSAYPPTPPRNDGLTIAGFVLSLVGLIPCFWLFQIPALLGFIFGMVGRGRISGSGGRLTGRGMALAAILIGAILVALCALFWVLVVTDSDRCVSFGGDFCDSR